MHTNIVICGGALAGMTLALSLQSKGFDIVIIDPRDTKEVIEQDKRTTAIAAMALFVAAFTGGSGGYQSKRGGL